MNQLTSSAGEGFSEADAEFAISYPHPNRNQQAVESAQNYLQMGGFSRASLLQQLTSSAGEGFTEAQATFAGNKRARAPEPQVRSENEHGLVRVTAVPADGRS
jgi:hypothetical protein